MCIGASAFGAGELILHNKEKKNVEVQTKNLYETLTEAKAKNKSILEMIPKIESEALKSDIKEIYETTNKIINTIEKNPEKYKKMNNFFEYYLPVTLNILNKYDEIENQKLVSKDGKNFMTKTENMINKINVAFKNQLANLYQDDIVDTDAEMKVFDAMLKADGYDNSNEFEK